jgi:hypothetical protein
MFVASGCAGFFKTDAVPAGAAKTVPNERMLAFQNEVVGYSKLVITRDTGYLGGGCYIAIEIERTLAARLDTGESATFYVPPGEVEVSVVPDPLGRGLCALGDYEPVRRKYSLTPEHPTLFRLSSRQYRRPELELFEGSASRSPEISTAEEKTDLFTEMTKLDELRKKGLLTDVEFESEKKKLLDRSK